MADRYVTITGFKHYYDLTPFRIGGLIRCSKDVDNPHDGEAIRCSLPHLGTVGYLANSPSTVPERFYVRVCFTTFTKVICRLETDVPLKRLDTELFGQLKNGDDWNC